MSSSRNSAQTLDRTFRDLSDEEVADIEKASALARYGWGGGFGWDELLRSKRILIVSEAGAGKTYECQAQQAKLWQAGDAAFYMDLATLAQSSVRDMLGGEGEEERLDAWLISQSDVATFFLDSFDELKLTLGKFDQALKRLRKAIDGQLGRARIIITTRPVPIDRDLIRQILPIPPSREAVPTAEAFADMMMDRHKGAVDERAPKLWRNVGLMPLSQEQMRTFAALQGVADPGPLLRDIRQRDAEEFAQRPQDLIEICADWREHHLIRTHRQQVDTNVANKLKPSPDRPEKAELSQEAAIEGASRLALAAMLTRKLTLRHSANSDDVHASEPALDPSKILLDWGREQRETLLERPLFGFASYGRVRFHHRSVVEFLAAKRLDALIERRVPVKSIKRLLFTQTAQSKRTVRPSMRPVAAWLASSRDTVFDDVIALDPAVVIEHGDPQSLRPAQRIRALEAYVGRYGKGGWRGLNTRRIQIHRFASPDLGETVKRLWGSDIENPEVRDLLLRIIAAGKLADCADIAFSVATDGGRSDQERSIAMDALLEMGDSRIQNVLNSLEVDTASWSPALTRRTLLDLFPTHLSVKQFASLLRRVREETRNLGDLNYRLPRAIEAADVSMTFLNGLRQALYDLVSEGIKWDSTKTPHVRTGRPDLIPALTAACRRQAIEGVRTEPWIRSSLLTIRLSKGRDGDKDLGQIKHALAKIPPAAREDAFWHDDTFLKGLHLFRDGWHRVYEISEHGGIRLDGHIDAEWVRKRLADPNEPHERRDMMLWAEMILLNRHRTDQKELLGELKQIVSDSPQLCSVVDTRLEPQAISGEYRRMEAANEKRTKQAERRAAKDHASWVMFWREVAERPESVFADDRANNTAWNLWRSMKRSGDESRGAGWERRFIEEQFGKRIADRLRETMMAAWRRDRPTLRSERPEGEKDTFLVQWQFGLAGIAAEAEDPHWVERLSESEAELACRYAPIELNGFPSWLESLASKQPEAVDRVLGEELSVSLRETIDTNAYSLSLQNVSHSPPLIAALFVPRIRSWIAEAVQVGAPPNNLQVGQNLRQGIKILVVSGNDDDRAFIESNAQRQLSRGLTGPFVTAWLSALFYLNPKAGLEALEAGLAANPGADLGIPLFGQLFDNSHGGISINLQAEGFTPSLLLRLLRVAYREVRATEEEHREGFRSLGTRDYAKRGREAILSALLFAPGAEGWAAKLEMASDPIFADMKYRAIAVAEEKAAEEADCGVFTEAEFVLLDRTGETSPTTTEAMFALMRDRLDDIDDLLLQDTSPRALWATIRDEHIMRREISRALLDAANGCYTVDQEAVTADEKETDIRLRSTDSRQQGTIELKLADNRPGRDLFDTLRNQLLTKYMAADHCRAGCLLVTIARERTWDHPVTGKSLDFEALMAMLNDEAEQISKELGGTAKLMARGLDLRPRLTAEKARKA